MSSDDDTLCSGTYVIRSVRDDSNRDDEPFIMIADTDDDKVKTKKDQIYKWIVTYYSDDNNYTIEEADAEEYVNTKNEQIRTFNNTTQTIEVACTSGSSQRFTISPITYNNTVYYEIIASDCNVFCCQGNGQQVRLVSKPKDKDVTPNVLWDFEECSPYTVSTATNTYFQNDDAGKLLDRFGLLSNYTWDQLWKAIDKLNAPGTASYKLLLIGRHGHNEHNIKAALGSDYDGKDAALTQIGYVQAERARAVWDNARAENPGIGLPQISFCSPMRRALATNSIMFSSELSVKNPPDPKMRTIVVENCRERMYTDDSENRHRKKWIKLIFPNFQPESGFQSEDKLWNPNLRETFPHFRARARNVLDNIFSTDASHKFVSITAHHEWTAMIMEILGLAGAMNNFNLEEGGVIPVIVQYTPPSN